MRLQKLSETLKLHHTEPRDSSTYLSVFTGRLQWQTIVTLTLHLVDWSIYKQNVISNCVVRRSVVVTFKSWDHSAVHLCLSVQLWRLSCWTERVSTIHYFSNKQKSNTEITQAFCRGEPGWRKLPHWPTKNMSSLHRSIDEAIIQIQKYLWINENEKKTLLEARKVAGSATCNQGETTNPLSFKVSLYVQFIQSWIQRVCFRHKISVNKSFSCAPLI